LLTDSNRILGDMKNVFNEHTLLLQQLLDRKIERSSNRQG